MKERKERKKKEEEKEENTNYQVVVVVVLCSIYQHTKVRIKHDVAPKIWNCNVYHSVCAKNCLNFSWFAI
jgi:hypothetical protein